MRLIRTQEQKRADAIEKFRQQADAYFSIRNYEGTDYIVRVGEGFYYERVSSGNETPEELLEMLGKYRKMYVEDHMKMTGLWRKEENDD